MTRISVCMATYNGSQFLEKQIDSILQQLNWDDELIISDDGSTDGTQFIINKFSDVRIRVFKNKNNHGPIGNFENALLQASGQLIFLADQDDIWLPDKVNITLSLLETYDLVLADCEVIDSSGNVLKPSFFKFRGSRPGFWSNILRNSYMGCCMAFRRDVLSYALPFPSEIHMHDWWIGLLVEIKGKVIFYRKPLIQYVRHGNNASPTGNTGYSFPKKLANRFSLLFCIARRLLT